MSDYRCPKCGCSQILIEASVWVSPTEHGFEQSDANGSTTWDGDSAACCENADNCGHQGKLKEFRADDSKIGEMRDFIEEAWRILCHKEEIEPEDLEFLQHELKNWAEVLQFEEE